MASPGLDANRSATFTLVAGGVLLVGVPLVVAIATSGSVLPALIGLTLVMAIVGVMRPEYMLHAIYLAVSLDTLLVTDFAVGGIPLSGAKILTLVAMATWVVHASLARRPLFRTNLLTIPLVLVLVATIWGWFQSGLFSLAFVRFVVVATQIVFVHYVSSVLEIDDIKPLALSVALVMIGVITYGVLFEDVSRANATFGNSNGWATNLLITTPLIIWRLTRRDSWTEVPLLVLYVILMLVSLGQTLGRTAILVQVAFVPVLLFIARRRSASLLPAIGVALATVVAVVDLERYARRWEELFNSVGSEEAAIELPERVLLLQAGTSLFRDHWLTGIGLAMFQPMAAEWNAGVTWKLAHNSYLTIAVELGILGIACYGTYLVALAWLSWETLRRGWATEHRDLAVALVSSLLIFHIMCATLELLMNFTPWFLLLGLLLVVHRTLRDAPSADPAP